MDTNKQSTLEQEKIKALQNKPGAAIEEPGKKKNKVIDEPEEESVEEIQDTVTLINPDENSMNSRG